MTTTIENILDTTTTMQDDLFTTTTTTTTLSSTASETTETATTQVEITTTISPAITSEASTGTTTTMTQGDSSNMIVIKLLNKESKANESIEQNMKISHANENIIKLKVLETTTTVENILMTTKAIENVTETSTLANDITTNEVITEPNTDIIMESTTSSTSESLTTPVVILSTTVEPSTTIKIPLVTETSEVTSEVKLLTSSTIENPISLNSNSNVTLKKQNKILPEMEISTIPTISYSRGRMLTTPEVKTSSSYAATEPNMLLVTENDMMGVNNIEDIFGTNMQPNITNGTDVNVVIAIVVSIVGVISLLLLIGFLYLIRRRQMQTKQSQRCRPVSSDAYSLDNISVFGSLRRKSISGRASKRTYGNAAFDDPSLCHNVLNVHELTKFVEQRSHIFSEFRNLPDITAKITEVPVGCEDKNRFANIVPLPETRVCLQQQHNDEKTEYINANFVRGPNDIAKYYIATQAPLESTTADFWRMIWEQNSRVIIQATDLVENGKDMCYEYLPQSVTLDNSNTFGDFQVILKNREVKNHYAISTLILKNLENKHSRELTHFWYKWPEYGVPADEASLIAMLLEVRTSLKSYASEEMNENKLKNESIEDSVDNKSSATKLQGPLTVHCSPGTGRTGTIIACDMAMRSLETQKRSVDIPQLVYFIRRGRAGAVKTREQYELIYKVAKMYATKITTIPNDI